MIVELFGPSGAGKTTLAAELAPLLQRHGYTAVSQIGSRSQPFRRVLKLVAGCRLMLQGRCSTAANLLKVLPPRNELWNLRLRLHLETLVRAWNDALACNDSITIFDQGMVQAVCSLVLLSGVTDREPVARALELVSKPDLLVRFQAPRDILEARLRERRRNLGPIQRLLEVDLKSSLDHIDQVDLVSRRVESFGLPTVGVESLDGRGLIAATDKIAREVCERMRPTRPKLAIVGSGRGGRRPQRHRRSDARA